MGILTKEEWDGLPRFEALRCPTCGEYYWWPYGSKCDVCNVKLERIEVAIQVFIERWGERGISDMERLLSGTRKRIEEWPEPERNLGLQSLDATQSEIDKLKRMMRLPTTNQEDD